MSQILSKAKLSLIVSSALLIAACSNQNHEATNAMNGAPRTSVANVADIKSCIVVYDIPMYIIIFITSILYITS